MVRRRAGAALVCFVAFSAGVALGVPRVAHSKFQCSSPKTFQGEERALTLTSLTVDGNAVPKPDLSGSIVIEGNDRNRLKLTSAAEQDAGSPAVERHLQREF